MNVYVPPRPATNATESSPPTATSTMRSAATSIMSQQAREEAGVFAKDRFSEVKESIGEGSCSLRVLALLGSLALIAVSIFGLVGHILTFHWLEAVFDLYVLSLGILILILEYGRQLSCFGRLWDEGNLYENAKFLQFVWGRGILYFVAGTLCISQKSLMHICAGGFVCVTGIIFILAGRSASKKLREQTSSIEPSMLREEFAKHDTDGHGSLTRQQFGEFIRGLGLPLTNHEVESAFLQLDTQNSGRASYDIVQLWWAKETKTRQLADGLLQAPV